MLRPLDKRNLYEKIIDQVKIYIIENSLQPGDKLPTENVLAEMMGVSRSSVREAMKALETMGIVQTRPRTGCVVKEPDMKAVVENLNFRFEVGEVSFEELLEARLIMELAILPIAIERATDEHFEKMKASLQALKKEIEEGETLTKPELAFHIAVYEAAGNRVLEAFGEIIREFFNNRRATEEDVVIRGVRALKDHRELYEAIRNKDLERAQSIIRRHMQPYMKNKSSSNR